MAKAQKFNKVLEVLESKEISQYRLAKLSGVSAALINAYCQNTRQPSLETLYKLAKALKVTPCDLLA